MNTTKRIKGFDGLRAIAVTAVFFGHMRPVSVPLGAMAVYMFFVLSGFLISGILSEHRASVEKGGNAFGEMATFYYRRSLRIFPIYFAVLFSFAFWIWLQSDHLPAGLWSYILYVANIWQIDNGTCDVLLCHFWSLSIEEQFYVFLAPLLLYVAFSRHIHVLVSIFVISVAFIFLAPFFAGTNTEKYLLSLGNFSMLAAGGLMSLMYRRHIIGGVSALGGTAAVAVIVLFLLTGQLVKTFSPHLYSMFFVLMILGLATGLCWIVFHQESIVVQLLEWRPLAYLGTISYGFYLMHPGAIHTWRGLVHWPESLTEMLSKNSLAAISATIVFSATFIASHISWKFFEKPILKHRNRFDFSKVHAANIKLNEQTAEQ